ncbi:LysM peptidoglycan-binding domain-containing protein [Vibrio algivorus]|uniref:LysM peptidoglycan-binding domain-containing protein n=1 Tax=Vibrio algivorus TaxID=1667024 RepID=A0A557NYC2_9VIBR|nr:LysM domain-containing protein [Vibrio algivorus]TVO33399.1 LysM peptidoglycan-binding domain-containing protein [Vibrio algivorus]
MAQYTILKDDCLSLLAQRFNTSPEILMRLNSEQIKNPDLIYEGNTLTLPDPVIESIPLDGSRTELPPAPEELAGGEDTCSPPIDLADILYVPAHPKTGKQCWYGITQEAKQIIEQEKALLDGTIVEGDVQTTTQNLSQLGVLSKFAAKHFEQFMSQDNADDYKTLNLFKLVITRYLYKKSDNDPFDVLYDMAEKANVDMVNLKGKVENWRRYSEYIKSRLKQSDAFKRKMQNRQRSRSGVDAISGASINTARIEVTRQAKADQYLLDQLHNTVLSDITDKIESMEEAAIDNAEGMDSDDGTEFVYREELKYFTSEQQETIEKYAKMLSDNHDEMSIAQLPHDKAKQKLKALIRQPQEVFSPYGVSWYSAAVSNLNRQGLVVKEQCLTLAQLEGDSLANQGPKVLNEKMPNWRAANQVIDIKEDDFISDLYLKCLGGAEDKELKDVVNRVDLDWSYYPSLALITLIDNTITEHQKNLAQVLGTKLPLDELFNQLLWVKKVAKARIELLKGVAQSRLESSNPTLEFESPFVASLPAKLTLLWENTYKPKIKNKQGFANDAKLNDLQMVECSLMSSGELFYLRGPAWYMPESNEDTLCSQAKEHVRNITSQITFASQQSNSETPVSSLSEALEKLKNPEVKLDLFPLTKEAAFDTAFWSDGYHYQNGISPDGKEAQYSADAGAQLFRFSSKAAATLNTPLSSYQNALKNPKQLGGSGEVSANFTLLQAQASFMFWLPFEKGNVGVKEVKEAKGYELKLDYVDTHNKAHQYEVGCLAAKVEGSVYGLAGASCQLSAKVAFGPSDTGSGNFGIKGSSVTAFDPNIQRVSVLNTGPVSSDYAAEAGVTVDAFAGVEAGGSLGATVYWQPPPIKEKNQYQQLGSINGELSASFGVGSKGEFRLLFQGGVLVLVSSAKLVMGPGASGKLAINLDMLGVDRFVDTLLGVLKQHDFKRLSVFGDVDKDGNNKDFEKLNNVLTLAMTMGLSVADVLLMPVSTWAEYKQSTLSKEYAPLLATNIIRTDRQATMKAWVTKLPPETLRNLFVTLIMEQDKPSGQYNVAQSNQRLAQSIVQIMQWLVDDENDNVSSKRQWKEALIRMNDEPAILQDKPLQWESFKDNWFKLARFVKPFSVNRLDVDFDRLSSALCQNMVLTYSDEMEDPSANSYQSSYVTLPKVKVRRYHAYPISMVENPLDKNEPIQIRNTDDEIETKQEFIMEWTINAALS